MKSIIRKVATPIITAILILAVSIPLLYLPDTASGESDKTVYYLLTDHLGSVDVVLDENGNVVERRDYLPYGSERVTSTEPAAPETDYGFTGKELDDETGLQYYGARYYDPLIGRFVSVDPVVKDEGSKPLADILPNPQALNAYSYVQNNPVRYVDETGMYGQEVHYDLTFYLALQAGLTKGQSKAIAYNDQRVDENPATKPSAKNFFQDPVQIDRYHFQPRDTAEENLLKAIESKSSPSFGTALHTYQDTYSHSDLTQIDHLILDVKFQNPDRTYADIPKAMDMAKNSFLFLRLHNLRTNGSGDMTPAEYRRQSVEIWNTIAPDIENYLSQKDKDDTDIAKVAKTAKEED